MEFTGCYGGQSLASSLHHPYNQAILQPLSEKQNIYYREEGFVVLLADITVQITPSRIPLEQKKGVSLNHLLQKDCLLHSCK